MISPIFHASRKLKLGGGGKVGGGGGVGYHPGCIIRVVGMAINLRKSRNSSSLGSPFPRYQSSLSHFPGTTTHSGLCHFN